MATSRIPSQPDLPDVDTPNYDKELSRKLYNILRQIALKLDELERRIKELET